jgi:poly-gamma-glutamate synthesis protein (capsule biosynthesis protein)
MLGDASQDMLEQHGYAWPFEYLLPNLGADYMVINLEAPITTDVEPWDTERSWSYNVQPESAHALAKIGVNAVSLANNHSLDRGPEGLSDTLKHLDTAGIEAFGAGKNLQNASMPLIIETPHGRVGVIGLTYPQDEKYQANEKNPGVVMLSEATITRGMNWHIWQARTRWLLSCTGGATTAMSPTINSAGVGYLPGRVTTL